jgi:hypothetical protein
VNDFRKISRCGLGAAALTLGTTMLVAAGPAARLVGLPAGPRSLFGLRIFGVRDMCFGVGLLRAEDPAQADLMLELVALSQVGDVAVTLAMAARGSLDRRAALLALVAAPATFVVALAARRR